MNTFKDFNIVSKIPAFTGEKISVQKLLNNPIVILGFKVEPSKKKEGTEFLTLQIEKSGEKRIVFSGSKGLMHQIKQVPDTKFPFETTIIRENEYLEFT
jgi:hypothetical protein